MTQETKNAVKKLKEFKSEKLLGATMTRLLSCQQILTVRFDHVTIAKGFELKPHIHEDSETFIYILEGTAIAILDDNKSRVSAGDTIYIAAGVSHGFITPEQTISLLVVQSPPIYSEESQPHIHFDKI
ncbi:MAG: Cupin domain [Cyanobacteriota bacterium]|jgi:quercetin dioxygenase-like cupin family protein